MLDQINALIKEAMKAKDKPRLGALRYLKSMLMENDTSTKPIEHQDVVIKHYKKLNDSLEMYKDNAEKLAELNAEIAVVGEFMPKQLSQDEVVAMINDIKSGLDNPNMGAVMKELSPKIKGQFDGKLASKLVMEALK
jgi:uncharacterized protein YqeY